MMYGALIAPHTSGRQSPSMEHLPAPPHKSRSFLHRLSTRLSPQFLLLVLLNISLYLFFNLNTSTSPVRETFSYVLPSFPSIRRPFLHSNPANDDLLWSTAANHQLPPSVALSRGGFGDGAGNVVDTLTCELCVSQPSHPLCVYGLDNVRLSRAYLGSGHRVRKVIEKALRGEVVEISVIGGSVSVGVGIPMVEINKGEKRWQDWFLEDFQALFPRTIMHQGAMGGLGSEFFSFCFESVVPKTSDLYIVELDINNNADHDTMVADDALLRGLLELPQAPAVIRAQVFSIIFPDLLRGSMSSIVLAQWFDVPVISIRNWLLPHVTLHEDSLPEVFGRVQQTTEVDYRHISYRSHKALGAMFSIYMREQLCEVNRRRANPPPTLPTTDPFFTKPEDLGKVPRLQPWTSFAAPPLDPVSPSCQVAASSMRPMLPNVTTGDWHLEEWHGKKAWVSSQVGSEISFAFRGTRIGVFVWTSNGVGYPIQPGRAVCWVVGHPDVVVVDSYWEKSFGGPTFDLVAKGLPSGEHVLTCHTIAETSTGGTEVRLSGVASY